MSRQVWRMGRRVLGLALVALGALGAAAQAQVGVQPVSWQLPDASAALASESAGQLRGVVFYPSPAPATPQRAGPFGFDAAPGAAVTPGRHPLVLLSHGSGSHELGHAWLAVALARAGYIVAALRHPGDNFEDRSAVPRADFFGRRPRQVSALLSALLADAAWAGRIDAQRVAVVGHSAGGHVALALAGAEPAPERAAAHCGPDGAGRREDAAMCALGGQRPPEPPPAMGTAQATAGAATRDPRIRAVVAVAPLGVVLAPPSLARVTVPVLIEYGSRDEVLAPQLHAQALCAALPQARCVRTEGAGHFAFFQAGTGALAGAAGDPSVDPPGFDRAGWQASAGARVLDFLARALR